MVDRLTVFLKEFFEKVEKNPADVMKKSGEKFPEGEELTRYVYGSKDWWESSCRLFFTHWILYVSKAGDRHMRDALTLCLLDNFTCFLSFADFFQNQYFRKIISGLPSECQTLRKDYQPTTPVRKKLIQTSKYRLGRLDIHMNHIYSKCFSTTLACQSEFSKWKWWITGIF